MLNVFSNRIFFSEHSQNWSSSVQEVQSRGSFLYFDWITELIRSVILELLFSFFKFHSLELTRVGTLSLFEITYYKERIISGIKLKRIRKKKATTLRQISITLRVLTLTRVAPTDTDYPVGNLHNQTLYICTWGGMYCIRTLQRGGMYLDIHPPRPEKFPKSGDFAPRCPWDSRGPL